MRIIIIAAGSSTRLEDYSDVPKGLLKIKNDSIVRIQLNMFRNKNYNDIIIITGPNKEKFDLNDYFVNYV